jgi:hypothetical protein
VGKGDGVGEGGTTVTVCVETLVTGMLVPLADMVALVAPVPPEYVSVTTVLEFETVVGAIVNVPVVSESVSVIGVE